MILATLITLGIAGLTAGLMLNWASRRFERKDDDVILRIHDLLPKTQCAQCGYPGCRPYAEAIAAGEAINRCPPGGDKTIAELANLLGREPVPLADDLAEAPVAAVAVIREPECIGCRLCIDACPVDAIIGAPRLMHTVVADLCTGCELCIEPCPVDCIDLITQPIEGTPTAPATLTMPAYTAVTVNRRARDRSHPSSYSAPGNRQTWLSPWTCLPAWNACAATGCARQRFH